MPRFIMRNELLEPSAVQAVKIFVRSAVGARVKCVACGWMRADPNFGKEQLTYFPTEEVDKMIGWKMEHPGYDLYFPRSAGAQLGISESFFRESVNKDRKAPVIMGRGMIACNTPALHASWNRKKHHRVTE